MQALTTAMPVGWERNRSSQKEVVIEKSTPPGFFRRVARAFVEYPRAILNTAALIKESWHSGPDAFHSFLDRRFKALPPGTTKVLEIPIFSPSEPGCCKKVIAIASPTMLRRLRSIPRAENMPPSYFEKHPDLPRLDGGAIFNTMLEAIGMGVLSADHQVHVPFTKEMISLLGITSIDKTEERYKLDPFKSHFMKVVIRDVRIFQRKTRT